MRGLSDLSDSQFAFLLTLPLIIFAIGIVIYPIAYSIWISFMKVDFYSKTTTFVGFANYWTAITDPSMPHYLYVTLRFTLEATVLSFLLALATALVLNETFRARAILRVVVLLPWAVSEYATATTWRYIYSSEIGMINAFLFRLGLIPKYIELLTPEHAIDFVALAYSWHFMPLIAFFLLAGLQTIPEDYYKAAKVDGAGAVRRFVNITLPHLRYAVLIGLILVTMEAARAFDIIFMLTSGGPSSATRTMTYDIYLTTFAELNLGLGAAKSYLLIILVLAFAIIYLRALTRKQR